MSTQPSQFIDDDYCFACGKQNPLGLHLTFFQDGEQLCTRVHPSPHWQGFTGILHGGIQATVMDDLMSNFIFRVHQVWATTAELNLRYKRPVPTDQDLLFSCELVEQHGKLWQIKAECRLDAEPEARPLTVGLGRFLEIPFPT